MEIIPSNMIEKKMGSGIADFNKYPKPIIADAFARERCFEAFKKALAK